METTVEIIPHLIFNDEPSNDYNECDSSRIPKFLVVYLRCGVALKVMRGANEVEQFKNGLNQ
jgi:hypothetical protein